MPTCRSPIIDDHRLPAASLASNIAGYRLVMGAGSGVPSRPLSLRADDSADHQKRNSIDRVSVLPGPRSKAGSSFEPQRGRYAALSSGCSIRNFNPYVAN
jgi:hypothetical protein